MGAAHCSPEPGAGAEGHLPKAGPQGAAQEGSHEGVRAEGLNQRRSGRKLRPLAYGDNPQIAQCSHVSQAVLAPVRKRTDMGPLHCAPSNASSACSCSLCSQRWSLPARALRSQSTYRKPHPVAFSHSLRSWRQTLGAPLPCRFSSPFGLRPRAHSYGFLWLHSRALLTQSYTFDRFVV